MQPALDYTTAVEVRVPFLACYRHNTTTYSAVVARLRTILDEVSWILVTLSNLSPPRAIFVLVLTQ